VNPRCSAKFTHSLEQKWVLEEQPPCSEGSLFVPLPSSILPSQSTTPRFLCVHDRGQNPVGDSISIPHSKNEHLIASFSALFLPKFCGKLLEQNHAPLQERPGMGCHELNVGSLERDWL
jgi:hypothetical protein